MEERTYREDEANRVADERAPSCSEYPRQAIVKVPGETLPRRACGRVRGAQNPAAVARRRRARKVVKLAPLGWRKKTGREGGEGGGARG